MVCRVQLLAPQKRKSRKNAHFPSQICTFASDNSERSLVIQNNVPQSTPLISKSLPIHPSLNGNTLFLNKIVRRWKILVETSFSTGGNLLPFNECPFETSNDMTGNSTCAPPTIALLPVYAPCVPRCAV